MAHDQNKLERSRILLAIGLSVVWPTQQAIIALSVAGAALWSEPALALGKIKGKVISPGDKGTVIRRVSDGSVIVIPTNADGIVQITGMAPGDYNVKLLGAITNINVQVGRDGSLAYASRREINYPNPDATDPRARRALPAVRNWLEPVAFGEEGGSGTIIAIVAAAAEMPDVNTSTIGQLMRGTNNSREAAAFIVAEREKGGPYKDPLNFAQRVGGSVTVDFGYSSVRIGDTMIIARGGEPKAFSFKTEKGSGVVDLYGQKHNYVGHVTLLR